MKIKICRSCKNKSIKKVFDLGSQKLTGVFPKSKNEVIDSGRLGMVLCSKCSLLQLEDSFNPKKMYGANYGYMSSQNLSMINHLKNKSIKLKKLANLKNSELILDIGSNDGTFLNFFERKYKLIGIDHSSKRLKKLYRKDIKVLSDFFDYEKIVNHLNKKKAKIITKLLPGVSPNSHMHDHQGRRH